MSSLVQDWYLATLGIVKYVPKEMCNAGHKTTADQAGTVSSDALASDIHLSDVPINKEPLREKPLREKDLTKSKPGIETLGMLSESAQEKDFPSPAEVVQPQPTPATARFTYATWHPVDELLVVSDLAEANTVSKAQSQLLHNILRSINRLPDNGQLVQPDILKWPDRTDDESETGAKTLLATFFAARIKKRGVCWVLLMGNGTLDYLEAEVTNDNCIQMPGGATGLCLPSLAQMLADPDYKRQAWNILKPLAGSE